MNDKDVTPDSSLKDEYKLTQQLVELLKQEQAQLIKADIEGLIAVTEEKARAVAHMSELTKLRYRALAAAGFNPKEDGMQAWLKSLAPASDSATCYRDLLALAKAAKSLNNTNGLLISKHMTRNQNALNILQGVQGANLYGPNGQTTTKIRARGLVFG
ncbi:MAG: flagella synthesis protein FlgN [Burkholderiales bacterium]